MDNIRADLQGRADLSIRKADDDQLLNLLFSLVCEDTAAWHIYLPS